MKAIPLKRIDQEFIECDTNEVEYLRLKFPCVLETRILPVVLKGKREGTKNWTWNGDVNFPTLRPSISTTQKIGDEIITIGSPLYNPYSLSRGVISNLNFINTTTKQNLMQFDMTVNEGNSGGGVFNSNGDLVTLVQSKIHEKYGITNF